VSLQITPVNDSPEVDVVVVRERVGRGGWLFLDVTSNDPDNVAAVDLFADVDGDFDTDDDQFAIGDPLVEANGGTERVSVSLEGLPFGGLTIFAQASDGLAPPVVASANDVVNYTNVGSVVSAGANAFDEATAIDSYADGSFVVAGFFSGLATLGVGDANETDLQSVGGTDVFVASYDRDGALLWARRAGGGVSGVVDRGRGITALENGSCVVTGFFETDATFGAGEPAEVTLDSGAAPDAFVARYNADGGF
jgi:hypothetical protein